MKIYFQTLGCKVNQYETQAMESLFSEKGWEICDAPEDTDVCVINTCAVTAESERKSRQAVRHIKGKNPNAVIAVSGCSSQISPDDHESLGAEVVFGSGDRLGFMAAIEKAVMEKIKTKKTDDALKRREFEILPAGGLAGRTRAMLKIQDGCSNFCSYCVIPYARGKVRSRSLFGISSEVEKLVKVGYREIVLTGINISRYGSDIGLTLKDAVAAAAAVEGDFRLRFGSVEPDLLTDEDWLALSKTDKLCPHFHLPVQSGCDNTLAAMNRRYNMAQFFETVAKIHRLFPNPSITADIIVGFPGESDEDFEETCRNIQKTALHPSGGYLPQIRRTVCRRTGRQKGKAAAGSYRRRLYRKLSLCHRRGQKRSSAGRDSRGAAHPL